MPVLTGKMKTEKMKKLVTNLLGKTDYVMHIKNLKQALNHEFILKIYYLVIKSNKNKYIYIDTNTQLRQKQKIKKNWQGFV